MTAVTQWRFGRGNRDDIRRHSADNIDILVGDIFDLSRSVLGWVDAIYDRAVLVALPKTVRGRYAAHLIEIAATKAKPSPSTQLVPGLGSLLLRNHLGKRGRDGSGTNARVVD